MEINKILNHVQKGRDFIFDILFPKYCLACGQEGSMLCNSCFYKLKINEKQICFFCNKGGVKGSLCAICRNKYHLDGILIAGNYKNLILSSLIKTLKYHFIQSNIDILERFIIYFFEYQKETKNIPKHIFSKSIVVPVPLHPQRLRWRGFNQSELLANKIAKYFKLPLNTNLIRKKRKAPQAKLPLNKRTNNIKQCFQWQGAKINKNIILVDDVITTGSTLNECAFVLKRAGAKKIWGFVLAKG